MARVAERAGLESGKGLELKDDATIDDVWDAMAEACGITVDDLAAAVALTFRTEVADLDQAVPAAAKLVPASVAQKYRVFPVRDSDRQMVVATSDPTDYEAEQEIRFASGRTPVMSVASPQAIREAINATYSPEKAAETLLANVSSEPFDSVELVEDEDDAPEEISADQSASGPVVRLTNMVLQDAIDRGASDIHIQPKPTAGLVRYRVDGVLQNGMQMPLAVTTRVISRIKIMSRLDITDRLRPQDGRARIAVNGRKYDLRVSTVPTRHAEKAVIRILDPQGQGSLSDTGIQESDLQRMRQVLKRRDGIFVVTGPTGSGKTTTLYGALQEIATEDVNIMTVEDPVEYELPGLTQIQVEPKQGVTFASALRAVLRQDPDVIFVGEIRDAETAQIAAQASLTGHLVLATLHTNDAVGAIRRFADLGLDMSTISDTLRGALAQRLVRSICPECAAPATEPLTAEEQDCSDRFGVRPVSRAIGCDACLSQGYQGRMPVTEFLSVTPEMTRMILEDAAPFSIQEQARADGMTTLRESGLKRVAAGETTLEEVMRVVGDSELPSAPRTNPEPALAAAAVPMAASAQVGAPSVPMQPPPSPATIPRHVMTDPVLSHGWTEEPAEDDTTHVLVVDDDGANRTIARGLLEAQGYRVTEARDGSDALVRLAKGELFSLMVLDLDMPTLGGRNVLAAVRGSKSTAGLPVVVLTGTRDPDTEIELMESGADDYIRKPIDPARFLTRVKAALRRAGG